MERYINLKGDKQLEVKIRYELGGTSYFTGENSPRGIYVYFKEVTIVNHGGYNTKEYGLMDAKNFKFCITELKRKSQKKLDICNEKLMNADEELLIEIFKERSIEKLNLLFNI